MRHIQRGLLVIVALAAFIAIFWPYEYGKTWDCAGYPNLRGYQNMICKGLITTHRVQEAPR